MDDERTSTPGGTEPRELLRRPIAELEALGLTRPARLTLGRFLDVLVEERALSSDRAREYLDLYNDVRFGGREEPGDRVARLIDELVGEIRDRLREGSRAVARVSRRLAALDAKGDERRPRGEAAQRSPARPRRRPVEPIPAGAPRSGRLRRPGLVVTVLAVWTLLAAGLGYWLAPDIDRFNLFPPI